MPLAKEIAIELRKIADALDLHPEVETIKAELSFTHFSGNTKEEFLSVARILPHPLEKKYPEENSAYARVSVEHDTAALLVTASIYRHSLCRIIKPAQPAKYDCEFTLLLEEDAALGSREAVAA